MTTTSAENDPPADDIETAVLAGLLVYSIGEYHAAHEPLEAVWLDCSRGTDDERLLHGLIQCTAALYHARNENWSGAVGLAKSADEYLSTHPETYRGADVETTRALLGRLRTDPEGTIERLENGDRPTLTSGTDTLAAGTVPFDVLEAAAKAIASEYDTIDADVIDDAIRYAIDRPGEKRTAADGDEPSRTADRRYRGLLTDIVGDGTSDGRRRRAVAYARLCEHVKRDRQREADVDGLF